ncbi:MAG: hypothetical protein RQ936_05325 [Gammaproteobacteria bacterium]|nr:hypothetical protein [Gammaproteobacteria bacterium]
MSVIKIGSVYFKSLLLLSAMAIVLITIDAASEQAQRKQSTKNDVEAQEIKKEWSEAIKILTQHSSTRRNIALL